RELVFVHPFDDPDVIAGQGTIAVEILRQSGGNLDAIFVPVGGGGLLAGIAVYVKYLYPGVKVIGVEPQDAASMHDSLKAGRRIRYAAREGWRGKRLVAINSGANMNFDRLRHVAERADLGGEREALLAVVIPERPGSFLHFCEVLGRRSVTEFNYRYAAADGAQIFVGLALTQGRAEKDAVVQSLRAADFAVTDMTDDEMAKLHVRYMVGGHAHGIRDELLYRFEFP